MLSARSVTGKRNAHCHKAKFQQLWRERRASRFALDFLPAYSPELNPMERVWKLTRRLCLHNRCFATLDEVLVAGENAIARWSRGTRAVPCREVYLCDATAASVNLQKTPICHGESCYCRSSA